MIGATSSPSRRIAGSGTVTTNGDFSIDTTLTNDSTVHIRPGSYTVGEGAATPSADVTVLQGEGPHWLWMSVLYPASSDPEIFGSKGL